MSGATVNNWSLGAVSSPPAPDRPPRRQRPWGPWVKAWLFRVLIGLPLIVLCVTMNSEGFRLLIAVTATKLHKLAIPGFSYLRYWKGFDRLDVAHAFAVVLFVVVYLLWEFNLRQHLIEDSATTRRSRNPQLYNAFVMGISVVILLCDAFLFYYSVAYTTGWGEVGFSFVTLIATVVYVTVIVAVAFIAIHLEHSSHLED